MKCPQCEREHYGRSELCAICNSNLGQMAAKKQQTDLEVEAYDFAGFWLRLLAYILDGIIVQIIMVPISIIFMIYLVNFRSVSNLTALGGGLFLLGILYKPLWESSGFQASPGKIFLGIKVLDLHYSQISIARALGRHFAKILSTLIIFIGYIMAGFTSEKQALHDLISGCLVVRDTRKPAARIPIAILCIVLFYLLLFFMGHASTLMVQSLKNSFRFEEQN